jgi:hypothetical protein
MTVHLPSAAAPQGSDAYHAFDNAL